MMSNTDKTKCILITSCQKRLHISQNEDLCVSLNDIPLKNVTSKPLLGVTMIHNLSWEDHINTTVSKINRSIALLRRIKRYLPLQIRKLFFNAHILPHMDYCSIVWGGSPHVKKIDLAKKRAARVILDITDNRYPSKDMFLTLNWMPIEDRTMYNKAIMVYKSLNYFCPDYMTNMFRFVRQVHTKTTQSSSANDLYLPPRKHKLIYTNTFGDSSVKIGNTLSSNFREGVSLNDPLKVIPQFCIAHFYCAHLITYNFIIIRTPFKKNHFMAILCYFKTSLVTFVQRITLKSMFSKKAYKSVARVSCVCSMFIYLYFTF